MLVCCNIVDYVSVPVIDNISDNNDATGCGKKMDKGADRDARATGAD